MIKQVIDTPEFTLTAVHVEAREELSKSDLIVIRDALAKEGLTATGRWEHLAGQGVVVEAKGPNGLVQVRVERK